MTVSTTTNKVAYIGNGVATIFAIPFPFLEREHLKVRQLLNNVQTERTDWTVSGGNMVFATAPADDAQIVIIREVPLTQETDYRENEVLPAETLERNFDKLTMQVQQLKEQADRAVTVDVFDDTDAASLIPSIRQAVSDCAGYTATATQKASNALASATSAAEQAGIAAQKATEAQNTLANKADTSLSNLTSIGKKAVCGLSAPSAVVEYLTTTSSYAASADGFLSIKGISNTSSRAILLLQNQTNGIAISDHSYSTSTLLSVYLPMKNGQTANITFENVDISSFRFVFAQGEVQ